MKNRDIIDMMALAVIPWLIIGALVFLVACALGWVP